MAIAIELSESSVKIVDGRRWNSQLFVRRLAMLPPPVGVVRDEKLPDAGAMRQLKEFVQDEFLGRSVRPFPTNVTLTVGNANAVIRQVVLPVVVGGDLASMIRYEIENYLPASADEYVIKHHILEEMEDESGFTRLRIFVAALPKQTVADFFSFCRSLNLKPIAMDIKCVSAAKHYRLSTKINGEDIARFHTVALVDLGFSNTHVNIVRNDQLELCNVIRLGMKQIRDSVALGFDLTAEEADAEIIALGSLTPQVLSPSASDEQKHADALLSIVMSGLNELVEELRKIFSYYASRNVGYDIKRLFLYGELMSIEGVDAYLSKLLGIPAARFDSTDSVQFIDDTAATPDLYQFVNVLGALVQA